MRSSRGSRLAIVAATLALALAACGGDDDDATAPSDASAATTATVADTGGGATDATSSATEATSGGGTDATAATTASTEGPAVETDPDGSLKFAYHLTPTTMDPIAAAVGQVQSYLYPIYDNLLQLSPTLEVEPMLATEWSFTDDGLGLNLKLRDDVTFHDGTPFNADAVKANIERSLAATESPVRSFLANVSGVTVNGPYDVTLNLTAPDAALPVVLTDRPGMMISPKAIADGVDIAQNDAGSGPYQATSVAIGDHVVYERVDDYWRDGDAGTKTMEIWGVNDGQARVNGVASGQFDMAYLTPAQLDQANSSGLDVIAQPTTWYIQLFQNRAKSNLDNLQVRQAVAHAIDREAVCKVIYFDQCEPRSSIFPAGYWAQRRQHHARLLRLRPRQGDPAAEGLGSRGSDDQHRLPRRLGPVPAVRRAAPGAAERRRVRRHARAGRHQHAA